MLTFSPKAKILLYILLIIAVFVVPSFPFSILLFFAVLVCACRVPFAVLKRGLIPILLFLMFTFISHVLFQEGRVVYELPGIQVTEEGLRRGGQLTLRLFILILGAKVLTATTSAEDLVAGMSRLLGPLGRLEYVRELISTMSLTLRLLPIIYDEAMELYSEIRKSDGSGLRDKIRLAVEMLTVLFERSLKKAKEMSEEDRVKGPGKSNMNCQEKKIGH